MPRRTEREGAVETGTPSPPTTRPSPGHPSGPTGELTPMMRQYMTAKTAHPEALLLFRMGDFYELFYDDAVVAADLLGLTLTSRDKRSGIPMAGVPWHAVDTYVARLVRAGHRVAICDQVEDPKLARGLVERKVTELITPGTAIAESLLEERANTFLGAILPAPDGTLGIALADASTGEFLAGEFSPEGLQDELSGYSIAEVLVPEGVVPPPPFSASRMPRRLWSPPAPAPRSTALAPPSAWPDTSARHRSTDSMSPISAPGSERPEPFWSTWPTCGRARSAM